MIAGGYVLGEHKTNRPVSRDSQNRPEDSAENEGGLCSSGTADLHIFHSHDACVKRHSCVSSK